MATGIFTLRNQLLGLIQKAWTGTQKTNYVEYLVVAGGGGASTSGSGGGGLLTGILPVATGSSITVTVGSGGSAPGVGSNSVFGSVTALGGGGGNPSGAGVAGGSGSGASGSTSYAIGQGTFGQGNAGGQGNTTAGGGGGGAGTVGLNALSGAGANGGAGIASSINGTVTTYAGGGGAGGSASGGSAGVGGGGAGSAGTGIAGTVNTGGGGGGGYAGAGGAGGSGIVIISYPDIYAAPTFGGANSPTASTSGSGSLNFNGSSQYIATADTSNLGSGNFTIEGWLYYRGGSTSPTLVDGFNGPTTNSYQLYLSTSTNLLQFYDGSGGGVVIAGTTSLSINTWYHFAAVRSGTTLKTYINGVQDGTVTNSTNYNATGVLWIGSQRFSGPVNYFNGYLSNVRIVVGTAVYTANFTPPTAPLTAISGTQYLLSAVSGSPLADSSGNNYNPTNTTTPTWNQLSPFATGLGYKNRVYTWTGSGTVTF